MEGYSMPRFAPLYPEGPYEYDDVTGVTFEYPVERGGLERVVPEPLEVRSNTIRLTFYDYGVVNGFGSYDELVTAVPVAYDGRDLSYSPYLLLDGDAPMAGGREVWGIPKKIGEIAVDPGGEVVTARAARGTTLVEASLDAREPVDGDRFGGPGAANVYRKTIPAAEEGAAPVVDRLVVADVSDRAVDRALRGPGRVELHPSAADPLGPFAPAGDPTGYLVETSFTLARTENAVLHRFEESE